MRNFLRCLALAVVLISALASAPTAKAMTLAASPTCPQGGWCSLSTFDCIRQADCPWRGEKCICF
jgi:hypothetical protein